MYSNISNTLLSVTDNSLLEIAPCVHWLERDNFLACGQVLYTYKIDISSENILLVNIDVIPIQFFTELNILWASAAYHSLLQKCVYLPIW